MERAEYIERKNDQPEIVLTNDNLISMYIELFQSSGEQFKSLFLKDTITNYSFLLFILLGLTKLYSSKISLQDLSPTHYRILIKKDVPKSVLTLFQRLYEELTLEKTQVIENGSNELVFTFSF